MIRGNVNERILSIEPMRTECVDTCGSSRWLVAAAVRRVQLHEPLEVTSVPVNPTTLVVGRFNFRNVKALNLANTISVEQIPLVSRQNLLASRPKPPVSRENPPRPDFQRACPAHGKFVKCGPSFYHQDNG